MDTSVAPNRPFTFLALDPEHNSFQQAAVVVLPVPYDGTASFRSGARDGPGAIIGASWELEEYDLELRCEPSSVGIHTASAVEPYLGSPEGMVERVAGVAAGIVESGKLLALLGGDHSITLGAVRATVARYPDLSVLYLDAHADLRDEYLGTRWGHASTARRVSELCPVVLVGVRSMSREEAEFIDTSGASAFPWRAGETVLPVDDIIAALSAQVYVSVDLDVFDSSLMAAVGTPEPGGMAWQDVLPLLRRVAEARRIVGFDVVELAPGEGPVACAYTAAALVYKLIGYTAAPDSGGRA